MSQRRHAWSADAEALRRPVSWRCEAWVLGRHIIGSGLRLINARPVTSSRRTRILLLEAPSWPKVNLFLSSVLVAEAKRSETHGRPCTSSLGCTASLSDGSGIAALIAIPDSMGGAAIPTPPGPVPMIIAASHSDPLTRTARLNPPSRRSEGGRAALASHQTAISESRVEVVVAGRWRD
jgi:hypothetical protein